MSHICEGLFPYINCVVTKSLSFVALVHTSFRFLQELIPIPQLFWKYSQVGQLLHQRYSFWMELCFNFPLLARPLLQELPSPLILFDDYQSPVSVFTSVRLPSSTVGPFFNSLGYLLANDYLQ